MEVKERIEKLMKKNGIDSITTLLRKIYKAAQIEGKTEYEWAETQKGNFSKMLKGERTFTYEIIIGLERIFNTSINYILFGDNENIIYRPRGLEYTVSCDQLKMYLDLDAETDDEGHSIIKNTDEFNKCFLDYVVEYNAINGIRFLVDKHDFVFNPMNNMFNADDSFMSMCNHYDTMPMLIAELVCKKGDGKLFNKIFNPYYEVNGYVDDDRYLFYKEKFISAVLDSKSVKESFLNYSKMDVKTANPGLVGSPFDFSELNFINPLLYKLLEMAVDNQDIDYVQKVVEFGESYNNGQVEFLRRHNGSQLNGLRIDDKGTLLIGRTKIGNMLVYSKPINPELPKNIKILLNKLVNQSDEIKMLTEIDYYGGTHKVYKIVDDNYLLKKTSGNPIEFEMLKQMEKIGFEKVPKYYGTIDGVDKFDYIKGETFKYKQGRTKEKFSSILRFLSEFQKASESILGEGKVYLHGKYENEDFVYTGDELKAVVNWDNCYIGEPYEDFIDIIFDWLELGSYIRRNDKLLENIKNAVNVYQYGDIKKNFAEKMRIALENKLKRIDKTASNYSYWYETIKHAETFVDLYENELNGL